MITLNAEFKTKTFAGLTRCETEKCVFERKRDVETVDEVIKWLKSVFRNGTDASVDFCYFDEKTYYVSRLLANYRWGKYTVLHWDGRGNVSVQEDYDKLTTKLLKTLYLECVDEYIKHEDDKAMREA